MMKVTVVFLWTKLKWQPIRIKTTAQTGCNNPIVVYCSKIKHRDPCHQPAQNFVLIISPARIF